MTTLTANLRDRQQRLARGQHRRVPLSRVALATRHMRIEQLEARHLLAISPLPPLLPAVESLGTLVYRTAAVDRLDAMGQHDSFSLVLDANQLLSITARPVAAEGLSPRIEIFDPFAQLVASDDASGPNSSALVQSQSVVAAGTYRIDVTSLAGGGDYELIVRTGAAAEEEEFGGPANDEIASAQSLAGSSIPLPGGAQSLAVSGQLSGSADVFAFDLAAGQFAQLALARSEAPPAFAAPEPLAVPGRPQGIALGDMNGDGRPDIVTANEGQFPVVGEVSVLLQNADGTFAAPQSTVVGDRLFAFELAHFNGDSHLDVVVASYDLDNVTVMLGAGDGTFSSLLDLAVGDGPIGLAVDDLDADGAADIVVTNGLSNPGTVSILYGVGDGTFDPQTTLAVGDKPRGVALADLNHDNHLDLIVTGEDTVTTDDAVAVLLGDGSRGFAAPATFATGTGPRRVATADVNRDGHIDVVTANPGQSSSFPAASGDTLSVLLGDGAGGFTTRNDVRAQIGPTTLALADVNQDGALDIVTNVYGRSADGEAVMVLPGRSDGTFVSDVARLYETGLRPIAMVVGDIDDDGDLDIVATEANYPAYGVNILRGASAPQLELLDAAGVIVASGSGTASNADAWTTYVAPTNGTYYARIRSSAAAEYTLSVVRGATLDLEPNHDETFGATSTSGTVLGALRGLVPPIATSGAEVEPNSNVATATDARGAYIIQGPNSIVTVATGSIATFNDRDFFRIHAGPGDSFHIVRGGGGQGGHSVSLVDANGDTIAGATGGSFSTIAVLNYVLPDNAYTGDYYVSATYLGTIRTGNYSITVEQLTQHRYQVADRDVYAVDLAEGQQLTLTTLTPHDGPNQPVNLADPLLELFDPNGALVASDDNGGIDGRNARLAFTASVLGGGTYRVRVSSAAPNAVGDYVLVVGDGTNTALEVLGTSPADGAFVTAYPATVRVALSQGVDPSTVDAADLTIDGVLADAVRIIDHSTLEFDFTNTTQPDGEYDIALAPGAMTAFGGAALASYQSRFTLDTVHPTVLASSVQHGEILASGDLTVSFEMSEPLARAGLGPEDVALVEQLVTGESFTPTNVRFDEATNTLEVAFTALPEGQYALTLLSGSDALRDRAGLGIDGMGAGTQASDYSLTFSLDAATAPFVAPLEPVAPTGSWIHDGTLAAFMHAAGDVDRFTIELDAIERLSAVVMPDDSSLQVALRVFDPGGSLLAERITASPGAIANLSASPNVAAGTYTVEIEALAGAGRYSLRLVTNAAVEGENTNGQNDDVLSAEDLSTTAQVLGSGASHAAVLGSISAAADVFRISAAAGERINIALGPRVPQSGMFAAGALLNVDLGGPEVRAFTMADIDGDGRAEVIVGDLTGMLTVLDVDASGALTVRQSIEVVAGKEIRDIVAGDIDEDGDIDVVVATDNASGYYYTSARSAFVLLGNGNSLAAAEDKGTVTGDVTKWQLADLDGQNGLDLISAQLEEGTIVTRLRQSDGTFGPEQTTNTSGSIVDLVVGDIDGDGDLDIAASTYTGYAGYYSSDVDSFLEVLLSNGDGTFSPVGMTPTHVLNSSLAAGDLDGDGHSEIVVGGCNGQVFGGACEPFLPNALAVFRFDGVATMQRTATQSLAFPSRALAIGDLNGDGSNDIFSAGDDERPFSNPETFVATTLINRGDGSVASMANSSLPDRAAAAHLVDLNGDGVLDFVGGPSPDRQFAPLSMALGRGSLKLELLDASGDVIALGSQAAGRLAIDDFVASQTAELFVRVSAHGHADYSLVASTNAALEREPNDSVSPQNLPPTAGLTGHLAGIEAFGAAPDGIVRVAVIGGDAGEEDLTRLLNQSTAYLFHATHIENVSSISSVEALNAFEVVALPSSSFDGDFGAVLRAWVEQGGALITTDRTTASMSSFSEGIEDYDAIIPVDASATDSFGSATIVVEPLAEMHPVFAGIDAFDVDIDVRYPDNAALDSGAVVLANGRVSQVGPKPLLVENIVGAGRVLWNGLNPFFLDVDPQIELLWQRMVAYMAGGGADEFTFEVAGGETLILSTTTPGYGTRSDNTLDPYIELYNSLGFRVATDDNNAGDGRNALVVHQVPPGESGTYRVVIGRTSGAGDYGLSIAGLTTPPGAATKIVATYPTDGAKLSGPPVLLDVTLADAVLLASLDASDLTIDGGATVLGVSAIDGRTIRFALDVPNAAAVYQYSLAAGAFTDVQGDASAAFSGSFEIDHTGPRLIGQLPAVQAAAPFNTITLSFDEPIAPGPYDQDVFESFERPDGGNMLFSIDRVTAVGKQLLVEFFDQSQLGTYTFVLDAAKLTDVAGNPLDQDQNGTGGEPSDDYTGTVTIQSMDLVVEAFAPAASSAEFGSTLSVSWTIRNVGGDPAVEGWIDRVWLSLDDTLNPQQDIMLGDFSASDIVPLAPDGTYSRTVDVLLPLLSTLSAGTYRLILEADATKTQAELLETNNTALATLDLALPPLPDLAITNIVLPPTSFSNQNIEISWTVTNDGDAPANGTWSDQVFLSTDAAAGNDQFFGSFSFTGTLAPGQSIVRTQSVFVPFNLTGQHYAVIVCDAGNTIFEHAQDSDNTTISASLITITQSLFPDLRTENVTTTVTDVELNTQAFTVNWVVRNSGSTATSSPFWTDYVYLSSDTVLDGTDRFIGQSNNQSFLAVGDAYGNSAVVTATGLPAGDYYILVKADATNPDRVEEFIAEGNNVGVGPRISVHLPPPPDMIVTNVAAPPLALSGQSVSVTYSVENVGPGRVNASSWTDRVYLSEDLIFDANDPVLGAFGRSRATSLGPPPEEDVEYTATVNVTLPIGISGTRYILVQTDATNRVNEFAFDQNNFLFDESPLQISLTPPPDLVVETIVVPAAAEAGRNITVNYTAANRGATDVPNGPWRDSLYLSQDETFDGSDRFLRDLYIYGAGLAVDATYDREITFVLPNGISGDYYLLVASDRFDQVFELDNANNVVASPAPISIGNFPPDLVISTLTADPTAFAGEALNLTWTVTNQGTGDTIGSSWVDRVYLSPDDIPNNGNDRLVDSIGHVGKLDPRGTYTISRTLAVPFDASGEWFAYVHTDEGGVNGAIAEFAGESNNYTTLATVNITRRTPDLELSATSVTPENGRLRVEWSVANIGDNATNLSYWYDAVVASVNDVYGDADDVLLRQEYHAGRLTPTQGYAVNRLVDVPYALMGNQHIFFVADYNNQYIDEDGAETNNVALAGVVDFDALRTHYDFVAAEINAPDEAISGQFVELAWTVRNVGEPLNVAGPRPIEAGNGVWTDNVYLSRDQVFDPATDTFLGQVSTGIASLVEVIDGADTYEEYQRTATLRIPAGLTGPFYVFVRVDRSNNIVELDAENNNEAYDVDPLFVSLAPPIDLVAGEVTVPPTASLGATLSMTFTLHNDGDTDATGSWTDRLYLSTDPQYSPDDIRLSARAHSPFRFPTPDAPVPAHGSETYDYTTVLPPVLPGQYYLVLRTDIFNVAPEASEENNLSISLDRVSIDVPEIVVDAVGGTQPFDLTLANQQTRVFYYRFDATDGQTLSLDANFIDIPDELVFDPDLNMHVFRPVPRQSAVSAFLALGRVPTPFDYDLRQDDLLTTFTHFHTAESLIVPRTRAGTYYLRVEVRDIHPRNIYNRFEAILGSDEKFDLDITVLPFQISSLEGNVLGNTGPATTTVVASNFTACTAVELLSGGTPVRSAERVERLADDTALLTFDYRGLAAGDYEIRVTDHTGASDVETVSIVDGAGSRVGGGITGPSPLRRASQYAFYATYGNSGDADGIAPLLLIENVGNVDVGLSQGGQVQQTMLQALGISLEGPAGMLRPGELGSVPVYFTTASGAGASPPRFRVHTITADDPRPLVFAEIEETVRPVTISDADWSVIRPALIDRLGPTWGTYVRALAETASSLSAEGVRSFDVRTIFDELYRQVAEPTATTIVGNVVSESTCGPIAGAAVTAIDANGQRYSTAGNDVGGFAINDAPPGQYTLFADAPGYAREFVGDTTVGTGETRVQFTMSPEAVVRGTLDLPPGGPTGGVVLVSAVSVAAPDDLSQRYTAQSDGTAANFELGGLPAGEYVIEVRKVGYAAFQTTVVVAAEQTLDLGSIAVAPFATIGGRVVSDTPDFSAATALVGAFVGDVRVQSAPVDADGFFTMEDVPAGSYDVRIFNTGRSFSPVATIAVADGETVTGLNLRVHAGAVISGLVTSVATGDPLPDVSVFLYNGNGLQFTALTDEAGNYRVEHVGLGEYTVALTSSTAADAAIVDVTDIDGAVYTADLQFDAAATLTGIVTDSAGQPLVGAAVSLRQDGEFIIANRTNETGRYTFLLAAAGTFDLAVAADGASFAPVSGVAVSDSQTVEQPLQSGEGSVLIQVDPLPEPATIFLYSLLDSNSPVLAGSASADANGEALFQHLAPGAYRAEVVTDDGRGGFALLTVIAGVTASETVTLSFRSTLEGNLTATDGTPLAGATVMLRSVVDPTQQSISSADADGRYRFASVAPGGYDVIVLARGFVTQIVSNVTLTFVTPDVDVAMAESTTEVLGRVVDAAGHAVPGGEVQVFDAEGRLLDQVAVGSNGNFAATGAVGDDLQVVVQHAGFAPQSLGPISAASGATASLGDVMLAAVAIAQGFGRFPLPAASPLASASPAAPPLPAASLASYPGFLGSIIEIMNGQFNRVPSEEIQVSDIPDLPSGCTACGSKLHQALNAQEAQGIYAGIAEELDGHVQTQKLIVGGLFIAEIAVAAGALASLVVAVEGLIAASSYAAASAAVTAEASLGASVGIATGTTSAAAAAATPSVGVIIQTVLSLGVSVGKIYDAIAAVWTSPDTPTVGATLTQANNAYQESIGIIGNLQTLLPTLFTAVGAGVSAASSIAGMIGQIDTIIQSFSMTQTSAAVDHLLELEANLEDAADTYLQSIVTALVKLNAYEQCIEDDDGDGVCDGPGGGSDNGSNNGPNDNPPPPSPDDPPTPPPPPTPPSDYSPSFVQSADPNDILGPAGFGDEKWVTLRDPLAYTIRFENMADATAPAMLVTITQQLDDDLDFRTFRVDDFGFGDTSVELNATQPFFTGRLPAGEGSPYVVDVIATVDVITGLITWVFQTLDPMTGEPPLDALAGFLPPNDASRRGEGFVSYTVRPKQTAATGSRVDAEATIVFDDNEPIDTPPIFNTLDAAAPASSVDAVSNPSGEEVFTVRWTAGDDVGGSALAAVDVYVSRDGRPFEPWLIATTLSEAAYIGVMGHSYAFYSVARDNAGNAESLPPSPDATATVPFPGLFGDFNGDGAVGIADLIRLRNSLGLAGTATHDDGDLTGDRSVTMEDLAAFLKVFGASVASGPSPTAAQAVIVRAPNAEWEDAKNALTARHRERGSDLRQRRLVRIVDTARADAALASLDERDFQVSLRGMRWRDLAETVVEARRTRLDAERAIDLSLGVR